MTRVSHQAETELNLGQQILLLLTIVQWLSEIGFEFSGFHGGSDGKETACNIGDPGLIPKLGRCPGEGNGNPLQYSCLENPIDREAWPATVRGVIRVRHDLVTKPPPPVFLPRELMDRGAWQAIVDGITKNQTQLNN